VGARRRKYRLPGKRGGQGWLAVVGWLLLVTVGVLVLWWGWNVWRERGRKIPGPVAVPAKPEVFPRPQRPTVETPARPATPTVQVSTQAMKWDGPVPNPGIRVSTQAVVRVEVPAASGIQAGSGWLVEPGSPWGVREVSNALEAQIALSAHGINGGSIDGVAGAQTAAALRAFQMQQGLEQTGQLDRDTRRALLLRAAPTTRMTITAADLARLGKVPGTWLGKSQADELGYETALEMVAERSRAHPGLVRRMNPGVDWDRAEPGLEVVVPAPTWPTPRRAARMRVSLAGRYLRAFDERGRLLCHFPCSIGRIASKRPVGDLHVAVAVKDPNYTFDPKIFPESAEGRTLGRRLVLPPGPNNPVGVAWIGLDRPGFGIHGTPAPEQVGRTESHGCFRLANWNVDYLRQMVWVGMPVSVEP